MAGAKLSEYERKRDRERTPEPFPAAEPPAAAGASFVIQEHHARALHWDFRLERDGVLVSWAVPKGLPLDPKRNNLAKHTEDHPLEYGSFSGEIPAGEYGGGMVYLWDTGRYDCEKWTDHEVRVVLHGNRVAGRYVLFNTDNRGHQPSSDWMVHRMDPSPPGWQPLPTDLAPMLATSGELPLGDGWAYEFKWDGVRALCRVEGGRITLTSRNGLEVTAAYPELRALGLALGSTQVLLDGEIVAFGPDGTPDFALLQTRMHVAKPAQAARLAATTPVTYLVFDVLHRDGEPLLALPYDERRARLEALALAGPAWQVPPSFPGAGAAVLDAAKAQHLEGVIAKRRDSRYEPGRRTDCWVKTKVVCRQDAVVGGWKPGAGGRTGSIGSLLLGVHDEPGGALRYIGHAGSGLTGAVLEALRTTLPELARETSPFADPPGVPREHARDARWVEPVLVADVQFSSWTKDDRLRHPVFKGLRMDVDPAEVIRES